MANLKARHLRGVQLLLGGHDEAALAQFLEMLRIDRGFEEGLPRKALIDAFNVISDEDLVGQYRRRMASLLCSERKPAPFRIPTRTRAIMRAGGLAVATIRSGDEVGAMGSCSCTPHCRDCKL